MSFQAYCIRSVVSSTPFAERRTSGSASGAPGLNDFHPSFGAVGVGPCVWASVLPISPGIPGSSSAAPSPAPAPTKRRRDRRHPSCVWRCRAVIASPSSSESPSWPPPMISPFALATTFSRDRSGRRQGGQGCEGLASLLGDVGAKIAAKVADGGAPSTRGAHRRPSPGGARDAGVRRTIRRGGAMMAGQSQPPEDLRWLLEPPAPGEVHVHVAVGEGTRLSPGLREALEQLLSRLHEAESETESEVSAYCR